MYRYSKIIIVSLIIIFSDSFQIYGGEAMKAGDLLTRMKNLETVIEQLKSRLKILKENNNNINIEKDTGALKVISKMLYNFKADTELYDAAVSENPDTIIRASLEKYVNLVGAALNKNYATCKIVLDDKKEQIKKERNPKAHQKFISNMEEVCTKIKHLQTMKTIGNDINQMQINLNKEFEDLMRKW